MDMSDAALPPGSFTLFHFGSFGSRPLARPILVTFYLAPCSDPEPTTRLFSHSHLFWVSHL